MRQKGVVQPFVLLILIAGLLIGLYLVRQTTFFKPKALTLPPQSQAALHIPVCLPQGKDTPRCHARIVSDGKGKPVTNNFPQGYGPAQIQGAYNLGGLSSSGRILAIVTAFDHPNINSDLYTYSNNFGIPALPQCQGPIITSAIPCFQKLDQNGGTNYPPPDSAWAFETALDVEVAHGVCPDCKILLIEAQSATYNDLMIAIDLAISLGANVISNSWGSGEFPSQTSLDSHFNIQGTAFTFSTGDAGYGATYPAASQFVTSVGGTTLNVNSNNTYGSETAWSGGGSGCSAYNQKPAWQADTGCTRRTIADVSAVANPSTGAAIYTSFPFSNQTGWFKAGGTSLASPIIAATYALKGIPQGIAANSLPYLNSPATNLRDITSGSNGSCLKRTKYLCTAGSGYDGPTGLGTPLGVNGF